MLAAPVLPQRIADDVAARVGAEALHRCDALAEDLLGQRLHVVLEPERERRGGLAGDLVEARMHAACRRHAHAVEPAAAVAHRAVGDRLRLDVRWTSTRRHSAGIVPERGEPPVDQPGIGLGEIDGGQRVERTAARRPGEKPGRRRRRSDSTRMMRSTRPMRLRAPAGAGFCMPASIKTAERAGQARAARARKRLAKMMGGALRSPPFEFRERLASRRQPVTATAAGARGPRRSAGRPGAAARRSRRGRRSPPRRHNRAGRSRRGGRRA